MLPALIWKDISEIRVSSNSIVSAVIERLVEANNCKNKELRILSSTQQHTEHFIEWITPNCIFYFVLEQSLETHNNS